MGWKLYMSVDPGPDRKSTVPSANSTFSFFNRFFLFRHGHFRRNRRYSHFRKSIFAIFAARWRQTVSRARTCTCIYPTLFRIYKIFFVNAIWIEDFVSLKEFGIDDTWRETYSTDSDTFKDTITFLRSMHACKSIPKSIKVHSIPSRLFMWWLKNCWRRSFV